MTANPTLAITEVWRRTVAGQVEAIQLRAGVNLIVGEPNTGKTKWLETIDYMLGASGDDPYSVASNDAVAEKYNDALADKYEAVGIQFAIGTQRFQAERRWRETGGKGKIWLDDTSLSTREFQHFLMEKLGIPLLSIPSGNPYSGRTWPELSFRTLLPHFYRPQGTWSSLVEKQSDDAIRASVQMFLGLAEHLYTEDFEEIVRLRLEIQRLQARRDQFSDTLSDIARDFLDEDQLTISVTEESLTATVVALERAYEKAIAERENALGGAVADALPQPERSWVVHLSESRAKLVADLEPARKELMRSEDRLKELLGYRKSLADEADRFRRAESAHRILSDLRITHCPACSQVVRGRPDDAGTCFMCHQPLAMPSVPEELAKQRVDYERARLDAEMSEASELADKAEVRVREARRTVERMELEIETTERALAPARQRFSALLQEKVSSLDKELGALAERLKQVGRLQHIYSEKRRLDETITELQRQLAPILDRNQELARGLDYSGRAAWLEDGMNNYLMALTASGRRPGGTSRCNLPCHHSRSRSASETAAGMCRWGAQIRCTI